MSQNLCCLLLVPGRFLVCGYWAVHKCKGWLLLDIDGNIVVCQWLFPVSKVDLLPFSAGKMVMSLPLAKDLRPLFSCVVMLKAGVLFLDRYLQCDQLCGTCPFFWKFVIFNGCFYGCDEVNNQYLFWSYCKV